MNKINEMNEMYMTRFGKEINTKKQQIPNIKCIQNGNKTFYENK